MMQPGYKRTPPPWIYGNAGFNPIMGGPHSPHLPQPHGNMPLIAGNHGKNYTHNPSKSEKCRNFWARHKNNGSPFYTNGNKRRIQDTSRFANTTLDDYIGNIFSLWKDQYGCHFL